MKACVPIGLVLLCFVPIRAPCDVVGTQSYEVSGETLEELSDEMEAKGPADKDGERWPGGAEVAVELSAAGGIADVRSEETEDCPPQHLLFRARITIPLTWSLETTITLPSWPGAAGACEAVKAEWDRFLAALQAHEEGHDTVAQEAFDAAGPLASVNGEGTGCTPAEATASALADAEQKRQAEYDRVNQAVQDASEAYDEENTHGEEQGAELDTSITCPDTAAEWVDDTLAALQRMPIPDGVKKSLRQKLEGAKADLGKNKPAPAKGKLQAALNEVKAQSGKAIPKDDAARLTGKIQKALDALK